MKETINPSSVPETPPVEQIKLSDGRLASYRVAKTRDLRRAQKAAGKAIEDIVYHLVALCVEVDGQPLYFEDLLELPIPDFNKLMNAVQGEDEGE